MKKNNIQTEFLKISTAIQRNKYISAISGGLGSLMALTIIGSIFTLINSIQISAYQDFLVKIGIKSYLSLPLNLTTNLFSVYAAFAIAYNLAQQFDQDGFTAGTLSLMSFLIVTPLVTLENGYTMAIPFSWLGSMGLFVAMVIAIVSARLYVFILEKGIYIKMPNGVPPIIEKSFAALTPGFFITIIMLVVKAIFSATSYGNIHSCIFTLIQVPLQNIGSSFPALLVIMVLMSLFWFFGIHGSMVVYSVISPVLMPLMLENLAAYQAGEKLPHLITVQCLNFAGVGGSGATIGLVVAMLFSKSKRYKTLGRLAILPSICGINEPVIFGTPIVLNMTFLIPFIVAPATLFTLGYVLTIIGIMPPLNGATVPTGTPIFFNGFLMGGWQFTVFQVIACIISYFVYLPFFKKADAEAYAMEQQAEVVE